MGKGDIKTKRGKIIAGSYGVRRPRKETAAYVAPVKKEKPAAKVEKDATEEKVAPKKPAAKKAAAKKSAAKKTAEKKPAAKKAPAKKAEAKK